MPEHNTNILISISMCYLCGLIIPIKSPKLLLPRGYGIRNAINLDVIHGFDNLIIIKNGNISIPIGTFLIVAVLCVFTAWFRKTKLGQDMRAVGQDMVVSDTAGKKVMEFTVTAIKLMTPANNIIILFAGVLFFKNSKARFPWGTFIINITGALRNHWFCYRKQSSCIVRINVIKYGNM